MTVVVVLKSWCDSGNVMVDSVVYSANGGSTVD